MEVVVHKWFPVSFAKFSWTIFFKRPTWGVLAEAATGGVLVLEISQNSQENTYVSASFLVKLQTEAPNFIKKETMAYMFSCELCEISRNTFCYRASPVAASVLLKYSDNDATKKAFDNRKWMEKVGSDFIYTVTRTCGITTNNKRSF